jgi:hypothetical protein
MNDYLKIFKPQDNTESNEALISKSMECLDQFGMCFNSQDLAGMDSFLHFPHLLLSGNDLLTWDKPGQLPADFFETLKKTGWAKTLNELKKPILISPNKVHYLVHYSRRREDDSIISSHENIWILTKVNDKWGIALRSY